MSEQQNKLVIRPVTAILCDEIRRENNDKRLFIGVYNRQIALKKFSGDDIGFIPLAMYVPIEVKNLGESRLDFQIRGPTTDQVMNLEGNIIMKEPIPGGYTSVELNGIPIEIKGGGMLEVFYSVDSGKEWHSIYQLPVTVTEDTEKPLQKGMSQKL